MTNLRNYASDEAIDYDGCVADSADAAAYDTACMATQKPLNLELAKKLVASPRHQLSAQMQEQAVYELEQARRDAARWRAVADGLAAKMQDIAFETRRRQLPLTNAINDTAHEALASYNAAREGV